VQTASVPDLHERATSGMTFYHIVIIEEYLFVSSLHQHARSTLSGGQSLPWQETANVYGIIETK
jgi:hypothetical protein